MQFLHPILTSTTQRHVPLLFIISSNIILTLLFINVLSPSIITSLITISPLSSQCHTLLNILLMQFHTFYVLVALPASLNKIFKLFLSCHVILISFRTMCCTKMYNVLYEIICKRAGQIPAQLYIIFYINFSNSFVENFSVIKSLFSETIFIKSSSESNFILIKLIEKKSSSHPLI